MYSKELFEGTSLFGKELVIEPKMRDMPAKNDEGLYSLNSLKGFDSNVATKGRNDLANPFVNNRNFSNTINKGMNLLPQGKSSNTKPGLLPEVPDFNKLLQMGQQFLQSGSSMMGFGSDAPEIYPSRIPDPVVNRYGDDFSNKTYFHSSGLTRDHDRGRDNDRNRDRERDRDYNKTRGYNNDRNRDRDRGRNHDRVHDSVGGRDHVHDRSDRNHPYRNNRRDDRSHPSSRNYSSSSRRRDRN